MAFPTGVQVSTGNLDTAARDPSAARSDLLLAVETLNTIVAGAGAASGVAVLNANGTVPSSALPNQYSASDDIILTPSTGKVRIQDILNLSPVTTDELIGLVVGAEGDVAYVTDGDTGSPCIAVFSNNQWGRIPISGAISKTVTATITGTFTLAAAPE
jgi:hypothetical protein